MTYIHYGHKEFDINKFEKIKNKEISNKPTGGLWASPTNTENGWRDWCQSEEFRDCTKENSFSFRLRDNAKVLSWNTVDDLKSIPQTKSYMALERMCNPDFEKLKDMGYDAIVYNLSNDFDLYYALYGWDCDSVLIINPNVIEIVKE